MRREAFAGSRPVARRLVEELGTVWVDSARGCLCCEVGVAPRSTLAACMSIGERVGRWSLHAPKVQVDGAVADGASARHRDADPSASGEHGAQRADAGPHGLDDLIGRGGVGRVIGLDPHGSAQVIVHILMADLGPQRPTLPDGPTFKQYCFCLFLRQ